MNALEAALVYIDRGWNPVPNHFRSKQPINIGWDSQVIDKQSVRQYFHGGDQNVGVMLGPSPNGLTDVDLDCDEALKIAPYVLPPTGSVFGRRSSPASHWLYTTRLASDTKKAAIEFKDPNPDVKNSLLAEIRIGGKGAQTIFPGSIHESGEDVLWVKNEAPLPIDGSELEWRVALLASACLLARYWPAEGSRHDAALVVGGFLSRARVDNDLAKQTMHGICVAAGDSEWVDRVSAADVREGIKVPGYPKLRELFGDVVARRVAEWLDYRISPNEVAPTPLYPPLPEQTVYPTHALGDVLSKAAGAISRKVQVPDAIAAQSVLAVAALAAQTIADVQLPYGQTRPLSLFFVTVAVSGDRKTTADSEALLPIRQRAALSERFRAEYDDFDFCYAAWLTERKKIEKNKKYDLGNRREALTQLGPAPVPPLHPFLTAPDPTIEGLIKAWVSAPPSLGLFSAEGGQFIGGFGISPDHRLKTAAALSEMWDGRTIKRIRASDGVNILRGRRLSMHMMVQPDVSTAFLSDPLLRDQGLLSRVLVAAPSSLAGTRLYRETDPSDEADISAYAARILSILSAPWPLTDNRNELSPPALSLTNDAAEMWRAFYDRVERMSGIDNKLWVIGDFAAKAAEHAARIAGVLTVVADERATKISADAMSDGIVLMEWYINEALRLQQIARTDPRLIRANRLLQWLQKRGPVVRVREILQFGPAPERSKKALDETLEILKLHGWVRDVSERPHRIEVAMKDI